MARRGFLSLLAVLGLVAAMSRPMATTILTQSRVATEPVAGESGMQWLSIASYEAVKSLDRLRINDLALPNGRTITLDLGRFDVFAPGARLVGATADGETALPRPPVALFAGGDLASAETTAYVSYSPFGVFGFIRDRGEEMIISSGRAGSHQATQITRVADLRAVLENAARSLTCGSNDDSFLAPGYEPAASSAIGDRGPGTPCYALSIAIESDEEFLGLFGGNMNAANAYVATLMGAVSEIYARDVHARFQIVYSRLWATADPWDQGSTVDQLFQFRDFWNANMTGVSRHMVHFLSGRGLGGGVAYVGAACYPGYDYGLSANLAGYFPYPVQDHSWQNWDLMVVAHELGHNVGAPHTHSMTPPVDCCGGGYGGNCGGVSDCSAAWGGTIMSYCHTCSGGMSNMIMAFHQRTIDETIAPFLAENQAPCAFVGTTPTINSSPASQNVCAGRSLSLTVDATGIAALSYQWRRNGANVLNGGRVSGAGSPTLLIVPALPSDSGSYDVVVSAVCADAASTTAVVTVTTWPGDLNNSATVDLSDLSILLAHFGFNGGQTYADGDLSGDGNVDLTDLSQLLAVFGTSCP